jgi:hypothetical protein
VEEAKVLSWAVEPRKEEEEGILMKKGRKDEL